MDTRSKSSAPDEKYMDLTTWLEALDDLGLDTTVAFADVHTEIAKVEVIDRHWGTYRTDGDNGMNEAARRIANDPSSYAEAVAIADAGAFAEGKDHRDNVRTVLAKARDLAAEKAHRTFRRRGNKILDAVQPVFDRLVPEITTLWAQIPDGVRNLEQAGRVNKADQWNRLEDLVTEWNNLAVLIQEWLINDALDNRGKQPLYDYVVPMFMFEDYEAFLRAVEHPGKVARVAIALTTAKPKLLTIAEVDDLQTPKVETPSDDDRSRAAERNRNQAAEDFDAVAPQRKLALNSAGQKVPA